jgi:peptide/nickel transport system substrate-binding protein
MMLLVALVIALWSGTAAAQGQPDGQLTVAFDASIAPAFLDPAETPGIGTPFVFLYAMHDALAKPLPGNDMAPCLAESWKESPDGLTYEFKLRPGLKFHNGDPFTAEDVKFTFQRYKGAAAKLLHDRVKSVDVLDPLRIRFVLDKPWPDFLSFYATPSTGAAWIVPKKYIEKVGEDGFRRQPIGLGPYRFVRQTPGVELVLEANEQYWRKKASIKTLVIKGVPDRTTRLAMLKTGEADIGYLMVGVEAATIQSDSRLRLARVIPPAVWWMDFPEQFNPKSPWHDRRVRLAATMAVDKQALNEAERLGFSRLTGSIIPSAMEFALKLEPYPYDPSHAKRLLADAGFPNGFDAGEITPLPPFVTMGESVASYLAAVGIRGRVRSMERATFMEAWRTRTRQGVFVTVSAAPGTAAARIENFAISSAAYTTGGYPDLDELFRQQAQERDRKNERRSCTRFSG